MLARSYPYDSYEEIEEELQSGIRKELSAAIDVYHPITFDWGCIFSPFWQYRHHPIAPGYPVDEELNNSIRQGFIRARENLRGTILYPVISHKTVGVEARQNVEEFSKMFDRDTDRPRYSLWDCEKIYHRYGIEVSGRTEVRWAWKFNDLKPRIYFAKGPDQHYPSRYIQEIFNVFVDAFPMTHRFLRFFIQSVQGSPEEYAFIYDYACFTSCLEEIRNFTRELADFCTGVEVTTIDVFMGPLRRDLGEILHEFNSKCNDFPEFDARDILGMTCEDVLTLRHTCGMLGVPGNISSCTLLHGIHLAIIIGSLTKQKVVGDDAAGWMPFMRMSRVQLMEYLRGIGKISGPKMEFWETEDHIGVEDTSWHYVKRPIDRAGNRLVQKGQAIWPATPVLFGETDPFHTVRKPNTENDKFRKFASQMLSFALQFQNSELDEEETRFIDRYIRTMNRIIGIDQYETRIGKRFVRPHSFGSEEIRSLMVSTFWRTPVTIPESVTRVDLGIPEKDLAFIGVKSKAIVLAENLGYCDAEPRFITILPCYHEKEFNDFLSRNIRQSYNIKVHCRCPRWLFTLIEQSNTPSDIADSDDDD
jgi:hypothetical protein